MPPSSDTCDVFSNILASPVGLPQRNDSGIKLDFAGIFELPDDLLHTPGTSEDDLISVVLRDIQRSSFENFTDNDHSIYDSANSPFNIGSDEFDTMIAGGKETTIPGWSTIMATNSIDTNYEEGLPELQSTKVAHTKPRAEANGTAAKQVDLGHQAQSDLFHSMPSYIGERPQCGLVSPPIPLQQLDGARDVRQVANHSSAEPNTRRSNRRSTNTHFSTRLSRKDVTKDQSRVYHVPIAMPQHVDTGSALPDSTRVDEKGDDIDDRRPSPEVIQPRANPTRKRKTKSKPRSNTLLHARSECAAVNSTQVPPSPTQSSPVQSSPIQEYLRPIRGRPRQSKTSNAAAPLASAACDVSQPSSASAPSVPMSEMPEKATKTRKKPRKIVKPNPYPDLSRHPSQRRSGARTDNATAQDRPNIFEFPSSSSDESRSFVLTRAKWNQLPRSSSVYAHAFEDSDSSLADTSVLHGFEPDRPLDYPVSMVAIQPLSLSLAWSTHSNDTVSSERKRKLADYGEENEAGGSATRRTYAPGSSKLALYDQPIATLGTPFSHKASGYANPYAGIMQDHPYSLQMNSYRDVSARDGALSSKDDNDVGVLYDHYCLRT
ncbi:hypothetical protein APHAL10511_000394 [Amanita phalloides]|nr:hypothetical protein APHAL10511_000394 [Amanita phalloides]